MSLESDLFAKRIPDPEKLLAYGFERTDDGYTYRKTFMDGRFSVLITIDESQLISGKVIDLDFDEEYVLVHVPVRNSYAAEVRSEYLDILEDIGRECFIPGDFLTAQAERLMTHVLEQYGDRPDRPWKNKNLEYTVIRNHESGKWYGLIGTVSRDKLIPGAPEETVEILNLKLKEETMEKYLSHPGIFPAYHMNKKNWISVILGEDVTDETVYRLLDESHAFTVTKKTDLADHDWLVPANPKYYDVLGAFEREPVHVWPMRKKMQKGDTVYIYYAVPYACIILRCEVTDIYPEGNELTLRERYDPERYPLKELKAHGLNTVRFTTRIPWTLKTYLEEEQ